MAGLSSPQRLERQSLSAVLADRAATAQTKLAKWLSWKEH